MLNFASEDLPVRTSDAPSIDSERERVLRARRAAVKAQVTAALYEKAPRFAARRAQLVAHVRGRADDQCAADLVQAAIVDTYEGTLEWDHEMCPLEVHVLVAIRSRSRHDRLRAKEMRTISLDLHEEGHEATAVSTEAEVAMAVESPTDETRELASTWLEAVNQLAVQAHDNDVLLLLECYCDGATTKEEVVGELELPARRHRNARNRLAGYVERVRIRFSTNDG